MWKCVLSHTDDDWYDLDENWALKSYKTLSILFKPGNYRFFSKWKWNRGNDLFTWTFWNINPPEFQLACAMNKSMLKRVVDFISDTLITCFVYFVDPNGMQPELKERKRSAKQQCKWIHERARPSKNYIKKRYGVALHCCT